MYEAMVNKHKMALRALAMKDRDYHWSFMHEFVVTKIAHMIEYYELGENNTNCEEDNTRIIGELYHALELAYKAEDADRMERDKILAELYAYIGTHMTSWWD